MKAQLLEQEKRKMTENQGYVEADVSAGKRQAILLSSLSYIPIADEGNSFRNLEDCTISA